MSVYYNRFFFFFIIVPVVKFSLCGYDLWEVCVSDVLVQWATFPHFVHSGCMQSLFSLESQVFLWWPFSIARLVLTVSVPS